VRPIACGIARNLGIRQIVMYRHSSILSAFGLALADVVHEVQEPSSELLSKDSLKNLQERIGSLQKNCTTELQRQGFNDEQITNEVYLNLRYEGTDCALMTLKPSGEGNWDFEGEFVKLYKQEFGFYLPDRTIIVDDIRIRGIAKAIDHNDLTMNKEAHQLKQENKIKDIDSSCKEGTTSVYFETGRNDSVPVYLLHKIPLGSIIKGPAVIIDATATIVVEPACSALITSQHVTITVGDEERKKVTTELEPIQLSIFSHRFMSIAEQMGRTLQKTAISTNIKERLGMLSSQIMKDVLLFLTSLHSDFSCALFGADGGLVANAPHIPVHLGSLSHAVRWQMQYLGDDLKEGDVIMTNHPACGGSHLPGTDLSFAHLSYQDIY
jgi:5-oxoprolinase (ATP-hydrolysing)